MDISFNYLLTESCYLDTSDECPQGVNYPVSYTH